MEKTKEQKRKDLADNINRIYANLDKFSERTEDWLFWEAQRIKAMQEYYNLYPNFL